MVAPMQKKSFLRSSEGSIASYNYTDVAEGTGVISFYGTATKDQTTLSYLLVGNIVSANNVYTEGTSSTAGSFNKDLDLDFDTTFNMPKVLKGTAYVTLTFGFPDTATADSQVSGYVIAKLRKYSGTTETEIASSQSETLTAASQQQYIKTVALKIAVTTGVVFAKGDILRLTIEFYGQRLGGNNRTCRVYHDPSDRNNPTTPLETDTETASTQLKAYIPFKLDL